MCFDLFLNKEQCNHVIDLIDGKIQKSDLLAELSEWSKTEFGIDILDYVCDTTENELTRLVIVVWDYFDMRSFMDEYNYDKSKQILIRNKFSALAQKYRIHREYQNPAKIFVCYDTIADEVRKEILEKSTNELLALKTEDIWNIIICYESIHIFYETDQQIKDHEADGFSEKLKEMSSQIVRKYDNHNVLFRGVPCKFTSHQIFDEVYRGNWQYYYQDN